MPATQDQATSESIQISATAGAMTGSAASKKQPTFEQFSPVDMTTLHRRDDPSAAVTRLGGEFRVSACQRQRLFRIVRVYPNERAKPVCHSGREVRGSHHRHSSGSLQ